MSQIRLRVGLSGHRKLSDPNRIKESIQTALDRLSRRVPDAQLVGVSSGAMGADLLFAEVLLARTLPWILLLPFARKKFFAAGDFSDGSLARARTLAGKAERIIQVASDALPRGACFLECSLCTVDECDVLIAIWDGQPGKQGGTESAINHARQLGRPIIRINPDGGELIEERLDSLSSAALAPPRLEVPREVEETFDNHRGKARPLRRSAVNLNIWLVSLHQIATAVAISALIWHCQAADQPFDSAALFKVGILLLALFLPLWLRQRSHGWAEHRMQAEILRAVIKLWHLPDPGRAFEAIRPPAFEDMQAGLLRQRLASPPAPSPSIAGFRQSYLQSRLAAQLDYYRCHSDSARVRHARLHRLANACTGLAIVLGVFIGFHGVNQFNPAHHTLKFLSICLPLFTAALLAAITALDLKRRTVGYVDLAFFLQRSRRHVELAPNWDRLTDAVIEVERRLLFEVWEWYSVTRYSASH